MILSWINRRLTRWSLEQSSQPADPNRKRTSLWLLIPTGLVLIPAFFLVLMIAAVLDGIIETVRAIALATKIMCLLLILLPSALMDERRHAGAR